MQWSYRLMRLPGECRRSGRYGRSFSAACVWLLVITVIASAFFPAAAAAETIRDALRSTYQNNPRLLAERATLKAADEEVSRARSGFRPSLFVRGDAGYRDASTNPDQPENGDTDPYGYSITATQPIFRGFRTVNEVKEATARVHEAREVLRGVETAVLLEGATAYADVFRDLKIVMFRQDNVQALTRQLEGVERRMKVEEATRTELAQSKSRRQRAVADLATARAQLQTSRAAFKRVVGRQAGRLSVPGMPGVPGTLTEAQQIGEGQNPDLLAAVYRNVAADHTSSKIRGELLPTVDLEASHSDRFDPSVDINESSTTTIMGRVSIPIYQGGAVWARLRQANHQLERTGHDIHEAELTVEARIRTAWSRLEAAREQVESTAAQVAANRVALAGSKEEYAQGQIRLIEVLDAQQELNESQVNHATAQRDLVISAFSLLANMGTLEAENLRLGTAIYDPTVHLLEVKNKWFGLEIEYANGHREHYTADIHER